MGEVGLCRGKKSARTLEIPDLRHVIPKQPLIFRNGHEKPGFEPLWKQTFPGRPEAAEP